MVLRPESSAETKARRTGRRTAKAGKSLGSVVELENIFGHQYVTRTIFLTGRECPLTCTMCDLWQFTHKRATPVGSIPAQIASELANKNPADCLKLYNASNFFDPLAVPIEDYAAIAELCRPFKRVVVENHPAFNNRHIDHFQQLLRGQLEIAIGLESTNDAILKLLNKQMTAALARDTIKSWVARDIDVRAFIMVKPPSPSSRSSWLKSTYNSVCDAFSWGVRHVSLIPTRATWGLLQEWTEAGLYTPPTLLDIETLVEACSRIELEHQSISVDLWDWELIEGYCEACSQPRKERLEYLNESGNFDSASSICKNCPS